MDDQRVPIGRFSAATRLSVKALRHHDEIGLLVPAETDPRTGYRYYRHGRMIAFLERLLTTDEAIMPYPITLETIPDRTIASVRFHTDLEQMPARLGDAFGQVAAAIHARGGEPAGAPLIVFHDVIDADEDGEIEVAIPCEGTHDPVDAVAFTRLPGGDAAVTTHRGPYLQVAPAYHALTTWMAEHRPEAAGPPRESYLDDPTTTPEEELLTRVEWPVT